MKFTADIQNSPLRLITTTLVVLAGGVSYAALWGVFWEISQAFWYLPAGIRFVVMMYTRPIYWPIWLLAEWLVIIYLIGVHTDSSSFLEYGIANFMPSLVYATVIGFLLRKRSWLSNGVVKQADIVSISLAIIIAALATAMSLFLFMPDDSPFLVFEKFSIKGIFTYSLGDIAGVLFVWSSVEFLKSFMALDTSTRRIFIRDASYLIFPIAGMVALLAPRFEWAFLAVMFLPIVFLSLRYGWIGSTFSLMTLNIVAGVSYWLSGNTGILFDTQIFLVSVGFTGLFLGAAISHQAELIGNIRNISQRVIATQETERNRISKDLHDHVGQVLTALRSRIAILRQRGGADLNDDIDVLDQLAAQAYRDVHEIVAELSPRELSHFGLKRSLESPTFRGMLEAANITYTTSIDDRVANISEQLQIAVLRVSQEALSNVAKHSHATKCSLKIEFVFRKGSETIHIEIQDNGVGFDSNNVAAGHGLQNIGDRIQALAGNYQLRSGNSGTFLNISIPI